MTIQLTKKLITTDVYQKMIDAGIFGEDDRIELINGEIIEMSPINHNHAGHVKRINHLFHKLPGFNFIISIQDPIKISNTSEPEPDIAILKPSPDFYTTSHPTPKDILLIIEVADSSLEYDREVKLPIYANAGIPEYWIVNLQDARIEVYKKPGKDDYKLRELFYESDNIQLSELGLEINVNTIL